MTSSTCSLVVPNLNFINIQYRLMLMNNKKIWNNSHFILTKSRVTGWALLLWAPKPEADLQSCSDRLWIRMRLSKEQAWVSVKEFTHSSYSNDKLSKQVSLHRVLSLQYQPDTSQMNFYLPLRKFLTPHGLHIKVQTPYWHLSCLSGLILYSSSWSLCLKRKLPYVPYTQPHICPPSCLIPYVVSKLPHLQISMQECSFLFRDQLLKSAYKCKWGCLITFEIPAVAQVATLLTALYILPFTFNYIIWKYNRSEYTADSPRWLKL